MLTYLKVENLAVVEKIELELSAGLNIFTGETGAGKSILIDAISLFFKKKINSTFIRDPGLRLVVEALFEENGEEFILCREVSGKKSVSYINGKMVPFLAQKEIAERLLNIYGQSEHIFLLNVANHLYYVDKYLRNEQLLSRLSGIYNKIRKLVNELNILKEKGQKLNEQKDYIDFQLAEIEELKMDAGDDEKLEQRSKILASSEEILQRSNKLIDDLYSLDKSVYVVLSENLKNLEFLKGMYPDLLSFWEESKKFCNLLPELSSQLLELSGKIEFSEQELDEIEQKSHRLNRLKSKYNTNLTGLIKKLHQLYQERDMLQNMDFSQQEIQKGIDNLFEEYKRLNNELRKKRQAGVAKLSKIVEDELARLEMGKAKFRVHFSEAEATLNNISERGTDKLEFYFSSNPGQEVGKVRDVASGGELSRLMLVLKSIISDETNSTYIFDEVDTGIGGKTAEFVGEKLKRISKGNQVICISHLPQIASFADKHFLITKEFHDEKTFSTAIELLERDKVEEIARLMAGSAVNTDVLKAAENLLKKNH